ncbi:lanthionine synthetase C family protein [Ornithinibacillus scapharcae]|uniref:lanthionine synthetase C family protein n=1 Tax=Ornithinibacillus scapharcae TaxID=1147159 RepID=UPI0002E5F5F7|nr:lanthionine synthetase C family protein [Ornithinibacillus scapharcae]
MDSNIEKYSFSTIGFSSQIENPEDFRRDYVSLGFLIFYLLTPSSNIVELRKDFYDPCLRYLEDKYSLPKEFRKLITLLNNTNEKTNVNEFISVVIDIQPNLKFSKNIQLENDIDNKINKIGKFILKNTLNGENQFFPSDFMAREFLSITHGTAGVLRALDYCKIDYDIELSRKYNHIINENHNNIQINLNTGLAGICWYYLEQNATEQSRRLLNIISERQNTVTKLDLGNGLSGIGMLYLKTYLMIGERDYLYKAIDIGESILNSTEINSIKKVGISNGRSGISLFLLYLSVITNSGKYAKFGKKILLEEIEYGHEINYGYGFPSSVDKPNFLYPYFSEGTAGVAAVAIRYYHLFNDSILKEEVVKLGNGLNCVLATELGLYSGLTGIANTLLDYYQFTNDRKYYNKTCEIINNIQQFLLKDDGEGLGFPGSLMYRFSCDYSTGASGFIMLLERIKSNKNNFHFFLDELFINTNSPIKLEKVISQT